MDSIVKMRVAEAIADERDNNRKTENELVRTKNILRVSPLPFALFKFEDLLKIILTHFILIGSRKKV
jgi:hypothetical protein